LDVRIYPEGGYLIAGVPNSIYFEAFTPTGDPADFQAHLIKEIDTSKLRVSEEAVVTTHEGRGKYQFTPEPKK